MIINRTLETITIKFQQRDWKCGRANNVIQDIKADLPRRSWDYDGETHTWILKRSQSTDPLIEEIIKRHTVDPNQLALFDQPVLFGQAA